MGSMVEGQPSVWPVCWPEPEQQGQGGGFPPPPSAIALLRFSRGRMRPQRTTTLAPTGTRSYRSVTSALVMRMQPEDTLVPIVSGSLVP